MISSPIKYFGSKTRICREIISYFPPHKTYIEPFGGSSVVLLNKTPGVDVYNDLNYELYNLFRCLRDEPDLIRLIELTPYSEIEFEAALQKTNDPIEQARRTLVKYRMSRDGLGKNFAFSLDRARGVRYNRACPENVSNYLSIDLDFIVGRLKRVQILNRPAIRVINMFDRPDNLFYLDPPYVLSTRTAGGYEVDYTDQDHIALMERLTRLKARFVLSGYNNDLYNKYGFRKETIKTYKSSSKNRVRVEECLWLNF